MFLKTFGVKFSIFLNSVLRILKFLKFYKIMFSSLYCFIFANIFESVKSKQINGIFKRFYSHKVGLIFALFPAFYYIAVTFQFKTYNIWNIYSTCKACAA